MQIKSGAIYGLLAGALWGTVFLIPSVLHEFSPLFLTFVRYSAYGLISFILVLPRLKNIFLKLEKKHVYLLIKYVFAGNILYYILTATAVQYIGVAPTSLIEGLVPVTALFFRSGEKNPISRVTLAGPLALILLGLVCINTDVFTAAHSGTFAQQAIGLVCAFAALIIWSWYAASNSMFLKNNSHYSSGEWSALMGVFTGVAALALGVVLILADFGLPTNVSAERWQIFIALVIFLALGASWLGNAFWNAASRRLPISLAGQMIIFETLFALLYGFLYYFRAPRMLEIAAIALLVGGVLWSMRKHMGVQE